MSGTFTYIQAVFNSVYANMLYCNSKMSVRELCEELQAKAIAELNEDPARVKDDIEHIKEWLKKQPHINSRTDDQWILSFLRGCKFSLEKTKEKIDNYYTIKRMLPEFYENRDLKNPELLNIIEAEIIIPVWDNKDPLTPSLCIACPGKLEPTNTNILNFLRMNTTCADASLVDDDCSIVNGMRVLCNFENCTVRHILPLPLVKQMLHCFLYSYPIRIKSIHLMNVPPVIEVLVNMIRSLLPEKIKSRFFVHSNVNMDSMYEVIPKHMIPKEFGGEGSSVEECIDIAKKRILKYRDWILEEEQYKIYEEKRPGKSKTYEELFGIQGSFRKLTVD